MTYVINMNVLGAKVHGTRCTVGLSDVECIFRRKQFVHRAPRTVHPKIFVLISK